MEPMRPASLAVPVLRSFLRTVFSALAVLSVVEDARAAQQTPPAPAASAQMKVFLDCDACYVDFLRAEIEFVDYVRDRTQAEVHVLITRAETGAGGVEYTAAFIGEVIRGGIQAVRRGQYEAAYAIGLSPMQTLRLVVFPQAMRIIVPPLTSQYLNLTKNSSLAIAVGFPDLFSVSRTIGNQTGAPVSVLVLVMSTYLAISLVTSLLMNLYNRRVQVLER